MAGLELADVHQPILRRERTYHEFVFDGPDGSRLVEGFVVCTALSPSAPPTQVVQQIETLIGAARSSWRVDIQADAAPN